jgi:hypothetical protein
MGESMAEAEKLAKQPELDPACPPPPTSSAGRGMTMAKNDYFVIVYKVLTYLYACLKSDASPDMEVLTAENFSIGPRYWHYIILNLYQDGYITGVQIMDFHAAPEPTARVQPNIQITPKGLMFLDENSTLQKVKGFAKDIAAFKPW